MGVGCGLRGKKARGRTPPFKGMLCFEQRSHAMGEAMCKDIKGVVYRLHVAMKIVSQMKVTLKIVQATRKVNWSYRAKHLLKLRREGKRFK